MNEPKSLIVEYEDGATKNVDFSKLGRQTRLEFAKLGLCPLPVEVGSSKHYLLMGWKDGWQEVIGIDGDVAELLRYYIIRRIEDRGRLSVDVGADYPELFITRRRPMELNSVLIFGSDGTKKYDLEAEVETWEGIFEAGGKKEYVKYDKTESQYPHELSESPGSLAKMMDSLKKLLDEKGLSAKELLASDQTQRVEHYKDVARGMGIRGYQKQEDVYGFVDFIVQKLTSC